MRVILFASESKRYVAMKFTNPPASRFSAATMSSAVNQSRGGSGANGENSRASAFKSSRFDAGTFHCVSRAWRGQGVHHVQPSSVLDHASTNSGVILLVFMVKARLTFHISRSKILHKRLRAQFFGISRPLSCRLILASVDNGDLHHPGCRLGGTRGEHAFPA